MMVHRKHAKETTKMPGQNLCALAARNSILEILLDAHE